MTKLTKKEIIEDVSYGRAEDDSGIKPLRLNDGSYYPLVMCSGESQAKACCKIIQGNGYKATYRKNGDNYFPFSAFIGPKKSNSNLIQLQVTELELWILKEAMEMLEGNSSMDDGYEEVNVAMGFINQKIRKIKKQKGWK